MNIPALHVAIKDPVTEAWLNELHSDVSTTSDVPIKRMSATKGIGKFLKTIYENPGLTANKIRLKLNTSSQCSETFTRLKAMKAIENRKPGYFITPLGEALIGYFGVIK